MKKRSVKAWMLWIYCQFAGHDYKLDYLNWWEAKGLTCGRCENEVRVIDFLHTDKGGQQFLRRKRAKGRGRG
jgi:hypothetical protein